MISTIVFGLLTGLMSFLYIDSEMDYSSLSNNYYNLQDGYDELEGDYTELQGDYAWSEFERLAYLNMLKDIYEKTSYDLEIMQNIEYSTNYDADDFAYWVRVPFSSYFYFRINRSHDTDRSSYGALVVSLENFCHDESVQTTANTIKSSCNDPNDDEEVINAILNFVQDKGNFTPCIHYISEEDDIPKYPLETLCEGGGDCEDKSILFVSLLESLGFETILIVVPGHCFAGVYMENPPSHNFQTSYWYIQKSSKNYYTCETTSSGWRVGDLPPEYQGESCWTVIVNC